MSGYGSSIIIIILKRERVINKVSPNYKIGSTIYPKNLIIIISLYMSHHELFRSDQIEFELLNSNNLVLMKLFLG